MERDGDGGGEVEESLVEGVDWQEQDPMSCNHLAPPITKKLKQVPD